MSYSYLFGLISSSLRVLSLLDASSKLSAATLDALKALNEGALTRLSYGIRTWNLIYKYDMASLSSPQAVFDTIISLLALMGVQNDDTNDELVQARSQVIAQWPQAQRRSPVMLAFRLLKARRDALFELAETQEYFSHITQPSAPTPPTVSIFSH